MTITVLIEVHGGSVQSVYADSDIILYVRDLDNIEAGDDDTVPPEVLETLATPENEQFSE